MNKVVLFIFYDKATGKLLREKRPSTHPHYPNLATFPSGKLETGEKNNLEKALFREVKEELGVIPLQYTQLKGKEKIIGDKDKNWLIPFFITEWRGTLPSKVLDKGNDLIWQTLEEVSASPITSGAKIVRLIQSRLQNNLKMV